MECTQVENTSDTDEDFEDALNNIPSNGELIDLSTAIAEVNVAISLFFNNQFIEAKKLTEERSDSSMYHSIGYSTMLFLEAAMTFEAKDITAALSCIKSSMHVVNGYRKKQNLTASLGKMLGIREQTEISEDECHAELIFAELNLFRAILTFVQDENLISFIRGALKIRLCYQTYNYCNKMMEKMKSTQNSCHFAGGVLMGLGTFNINCVGSLKFSVNHVQHCVGSFYNDLCFIDVMHSYDDLAPRPSPASKQTYSFLEEETRALSLFPPYILSLLQWIGFTSDKNRGLKQLIQSYTDKNLRSPIVSLYILTYHLFLTVHLGTHDADLGLAEQVLNEMLEKYPNGVLFHLYGGRLAQLRGNFDSAIDHLTKATTLQSQWKQFSHICYWELMWCHAFKIEWKKAAQYADKLRLESNWSKCVYTYIQATFLIMDDSVANKKEINELMNKVHGLKQRFAGKSIPVEKFVVRKARKYFEQGEYLVLPAHEMLYVWNGLLMLKESSKACYNHLNLISQALDQLEERKKTAASSGNNRFSYFDDYCLIQLLKGACLRYNKEPMKAELCLSDVKENYKGIDKDHYLAPAALSDLAWMLIEQERYDEARVQLKHIKKNYSHYSMESRLNFRIHAAQTRLNEMVSKSQDTSR